MKSIRERKEDLKNKIRAEKNKPITIPTVVNREQQYEEYKRILIQNGIRNNDLISTQLNKFLDMGLSKTAVYSNLKFINLFRSRLTEEGISLTDAEVIVTHANFNMSDINEDDDYIGDIALEYAELCKLYYDALVTSSNTPLASVINKFHVITIELPTE